VLSIDIMALAASGQEWTDDVWHGIFVVRIGMIGMMWTAATVGTISGAVQRANRIKSKQNNK
jgi:hypothetical protein